MFPVLAGRFIATVPLGKPNFSSTVFFSNEKKVTYKGGPNIRELQEGTP